MRTFWLLVLLGLQGGSLALAAAVVDQVPLEVEIKAPPTVRLSLTPQVINFPDADPDAVPEVAAQENPVKVTIAARGSQITLTARALTHLISGTDQIDISNVSWTASGSGFLPGRLKLGAEILVGQWWATTKIITGGLSFFLRHSWLYPVGKYNATVIFTATAL